MAENIKESIKNKDLLSNKRLAYIDMGLSLNSIDNLSPSHYFIDLSKRFINNEFEYEEFESLLKTYYNNQDLSNIDIQKEKECDFVTLRISKLLEDSSFFLNPLSLKNIHLFLYRDIFPFAGNYRKTPIFQKEDILSNNIIYFVSTHDISCCLKDIFENEFSFNFSTMNTDDIINHFSNFLSRVWEIHPFLKGNTISICIYFLKYFYHLGFDPNIQLIVDNSIYLKNSLIRSIYNDFPNGIYANPSFLISFLENLLYSKNNILNNDDLYLKNHFKLSVKIAKFSQ